MDRRVYVALAGGTVIGFLLVRRVMQIRKIKALQTKVDITETEVRENLKQFISSCIDLAPETRPILP